MGQITTKQGYTGSYSFVPQSVGYIKFDKAWARTPNYQVLKLRNELPMNTYTIAREQTWYGQGHFTTRDTSGAVGVYTVDGIPNGEYSAGARTPPVVAPAQLAAVKRRAEAKCLAQIKNQKLNLAQALAERRRTAELIENSIRRFVEAFRALRRRDLEEALRILGAGQPSRRRRRRINAIWKRSSESSPYSQGEFRNASSIWLEIQYGWLPLLNDIYESAQAIEKAQDQSPRKMKTTGTVSLVINDNTIPAQTSRVTKLASTRITIKGSVTIWYSTPNVPRTLLQLGFTNPAYLAWELTPFSFVVDWFIPIGNAINNFDATLGLTFEKGCYSEKVVASGRYTCNGRTNGVFVTTGFATNFCTRHSFGRSAYLSFPSVTLPDFKNPLGLDHVLNGIALLIQVFSGKHY
jgi:hypothetical protein